MVSTVIVEFVLDGRVTSVAGGSGPGDWAFEFTAEYPRSGAPATARIVIPTQTIDQVRAAGRRLYDRARLVIRVEEAPEVARG